MKGPAVRVVSLARGASATAVLKIAAAASRKGPIYLSVAAVKKAQ